MKFQTVGSFPECLGARIGLLLVDKLDEQD